MKDDLAKRGRELETQTESITTPENAELDEPARALMWSYIPATSKMPIPGPNGTITLYPTRRAAREAHGETGVCACRFRPVIISRPEADITPCANEILKTTNTKCEELP